MKTLRRHRGRWYDSPFIAGKVWSGQVIHLGSKNSLLPSASEGPCWVTWDGCCVELFTHHKGSFIRSPPIATRVPTGSRPNARGQGSNYNPPRGRQLKPAPGFTAHSPGSLWKEQKGRGGWYRCTSSWGHIGMEPGPPQCLDHWVRRKPGPLVSGNASLSSPIVSALDDWEQRYLIFFFEPLKCLYYLGPTQVFRYKL